MKDISRYQGCLLAGAAGDALGYPVEFMDESALFGCYGSGGIREYVLRDGVAQISDDTQMTLFTATGLLTAVTCGRGFRSAGLCCVWNSYRDWFHTQTGQVIQPGTARGSWLSKVPALWSPRAPGNTCMGAMAGSPGSLDRPRNGSRGCGGVMRVAPVGLLLPGMEGLTQDDADLFGAQCAALTHGGDLAWLPAAMHTHMVGDLVHGEGFVPASAAADALDAVKRQFSHAPHIGQFAALMEKAMELAGSPSDDLTAIHALGEGWVGDEALAIAVYCALKYSGDMEKALTAAVNHRGDSDSTGAVTGNILGAYLGRDAIPEKFTERLELKDVILTVAEDLYRGAGGDGVWREKYADMTYKGPSARHDDR